MTLEHYPGMAEGDRPPYRGGAGALAAAGRHGDPSHGRFMPGQYRAGPVPTSARREPAFAAAEFLMDYLKTRAPFWKKEERAGGDGWVEARRTDTAAAQRWSQDREAGEGRKPEAAE